MNARFVIAATDTNVGKTIFAAALTDALSALYWKPVQSGLDGETDSEIVARLIGAPERVLPEAYRLNAPLSPHRAAELDGVSIDPAALEPPKLDAPLVIEAAGGVLAPISRTLLYADVFARWDIPVIVCGRTSLGAINHALLTLEALRARNAPVHGMAFIGDANADTESTICDIGGVRRLGRLDWLSVLGRSQLAQAFRSGFALTDFERAS